MSTEAHTVHIGTLTSGVTVSQLAVRANPPEVDICENLSADASFRLFSMA
jgi:hypothetical protein